MKQLNPYSQQKSSGFDWLGEIPKHWKIVRVKNTLSEKVSDGPHETPEFVDEGVPFLSADSIQDGELVFENCRFITPDDHSRYKKKSTINNNDILMCKAASTGKIARVKTSIEFSVWSPLAIIKINNQIASSPFFEYVFKSPLSQSQIDILCTSNTQFNISMDDIPKIVIALPELKEQQNIAAFLDRETSRINALIQKKERLIQLLKEKRIALISQAVTKGLDPNVPMKDSGIEWLGEVPEHWEIKRLRFIVKVPLQYGAIETAELDDPDLPRYIRITDIDENGSLRADGVKTIPWENSKLYMLQDGDLLFARSGATAGKTLLYKEIWGPAAFAGYLIRASFNKLIVPDYISYFTSSTRYQNWLNMAFIQSTIQNISAEKYKELLIPLPEIEEQKRIVIFLKKETTKMDRLTGSVIRSIKLLKEYRSSLINAAVTGKIDVRNQV